MRALDEFHEGFDAFAGLGLERGRDRRIFHRGEDGAFAFVAGAEQAFHGDVAQAARGRVGDAQQADVVVRIKERFEIGEEIANFAPVKKALAANQMITHAGGAQGGFERARLLVGAKQNRVVAPRNALRDAGVIDLLDHRARFFFVVGEGVQEDFCAIAFVGPELFAAAAEIVFDDRVRRAKNRVGGAIILLELDDFDFGKMFFHVEQVGNFRAAPAVNALVVIADDAEIAMFLREQVDEFELRGVGVLVFVDHDVAIFRAAGFERVRMFLEQPQREQDQIVEIDGVAGVQGGFVAFANVLGHGANAFIAERRGAFAAVFVAAQQAENGGRIGLFAFGGNLREDFFNRAELLGFVVDDEIAFVTEFLDVLAENADAQGSERCRWSGARAF